MVKLLIIADDFTGALDTGVQFAKQGINTWMTTDLRTDMTTVGAEVLSIDAETRTMPPEKAFETVLALAESAKHAGIPMVYKKTDSTLRGNIGCELEALMRAYNRPVAFIPAYPGNGRVTRDAVQYANSVEIAKTILANDPINPIRHSYIPQIIAETSDIRVITGSTLTDGAVTVFDAESEEDLGRIFTDLTSQNALELTAGCAGFADVLASSRLFTRELRPINRRSGGILAVCGSVNAASVRQTEQAAKEGYAVVTLPAKSLLGTTEETLSSIAAGIRKTLDSTGFTLIRTDGDRFLENDAPEKISRIIGRLTRLLTESADIGHLILFGGHTANAIMRETGITSFYPLAEILPGVVYAEADGCNIVTKAGGFGSENVISEILTYINSL